MLAADKLQLQSALKQQAVALKEKEFNLHHSNLMTVGTQAAVLAGLDITMFIEFSPAEDSEWGENYHVCRVLKMIYYAVIVSAFCANMMVVSQTTVLSVLGAGLALRGPDGSMMVATDALYEERTRIFSIFGWGLTLTVSSVLVSVWLLLKWEAATACWCIAAVTCYSITTNYYRVRNRLDFDERDTVDFRDIMDGPAKITLQTTAPRNIGAAKQSIPMESSNGRSNHNRWMKKTQSNVSNNTYRRRSSGENMPPSEEEEEDASYYSYDYYDGDSSDGHHDVEMQRKHHILRGTKRRGNRRSSPQDEEPLIQTV